MLRFRNQQIMGLDVVLLEHRLTKDFQVWDCESDIKAVEQFVEAMENPKFDVALYQLVWYHFTGGRGGGGWQRKQFVGPDGTIVYCEGSSDGI